MFFYLRRMVVMIGLLLILPFWGVQAQETPPQIEAFTQSDFKILTGDVQRPNGIFWHEGYLYTGCAGDWTLYRLDDETGATLTYIFGIKNAHSIYVETGEKDIQIWAADFQENQLVRVSTEEGPRAMYPVRNGLASPWGLAPSATDDTFYITEWGSDNLINITRDGQNIQVVASGLEDPSGIVATSEALYVANYGSARRAVEWLDLMAEEPTPQPLVTGLQKVTNLVMGADNYLYIAYALGTRGVVGRVDPAVCRANGGCANVDVELIVWTELSAPLAGLVITPDMRLYVHTMFGSEIYWLDLSTKGIVPATAN